MQVSVIIPVYNAEQYLRQSVSSALAQEETAEVILVEDNSNDNSLEICKEIEKTNIKVKLFRHPCGANKGAGESRNLGIKEANYEYIAFLDADDYYLENRFKADNEIFEKLPDAEGVYNATGRFIENENRMSTKLTTVRKKIRPEYLFENLIIGGRGYFHIDGVTFRKKVFEKCGNFSDLRISQDTHFFLKAAAAAKLYPGKINEAVAVRREHDNNRITRVKAGDFIKNRKRIWIILHEWADENKLSPEKIRLLEYGALINESLEPAEKNTEFRAGKFFPILINYFKDHSFKENMQIMKILFKHTKNKITS